MRRAAGLTFLIAAVLPGCNIAYYASHNLVNEFGLQCGQHSLRKRVRHQAEAAWRAEGERGPLCPKPRAYADGFVDGYTDYVIDGGPVRTPVAAPPEYRRHVTAFTRAGQDAQAFYLAGFRRGAEVAAATGGRECTLVPLVLPAAAPEPPLAINCTDAAGGRPVPATPDVKVPPLPTVTVPAIPPPPVPAVPAPAGRPPEPEPMKKKP